MPADTKHYITLFVVCAREYDGEEPKTMESEKCEGWKWVKQEAENLNEVVEKTLFTPLVNLVRQRPGEQSAHGHPLNGILRVSYQLDACFSKLTLVIIA